MAVSPATEALEETAENGSLTLQILFFVGLAVQFIGADALDQMSFMVRTYQFLLHLPMLQVMFPPNVMMLYKAMLPIVCWDVLGDWVNWRRILIYTEDDEAPMPG